MWGWLDWNSAIPEFLQPDIQLFAATGFDSLRVLFSRPAF